MWKGAWRLTLNAASATQTLLVQHMIAIDSYKVRCPNCGEIIVLTVDCSIEQQEYIEDCQVCCQPILINVHIHKENFDVSVRNLDE